MAIPKLKQLANSSPKVKKILTWVFGGILVILLAALGLESTNNDWDIGKLLNGESWENSKVMRDINGNVVESGGKYTDEYNCDDFTTKEQAQTFFKNAGGPSQDTNGLDGDNDGEACEALPRGN